MTLEQMINKVHCADCLEFMKQMPDKSIDLVLTDPPYGINFQGKAKRYDVLIGDEKEFDIAPYWKEIERITKGSAYIFTRWDIAYDWQKVIKPDKQIVLGRGKSSVGDLSNFSTEYEVILFKRFEDGFVDGTDLKIRCKHAESPYYKKRIGDFWTDVISNQNWEEANHPTQKTIACCEKIIKISTKENDLVLDCFLGSGTTAVACKKLNCRFIGIEISPEYCKIAEQRLKQGVLNF